MLYTYLQQVRRLLSDQRFADFNDFDLRTYVNIARNHIATDLEILRFPADLQLTSGQQVYAVSSAVPITEPVTVTGLGKINLLLSAALKIQDGFQRINVRNWVWFESFYINNVVQETDQPTEVSQQLLGSDAGTLWFWPVPNNDYVVRLYPVWTLEALQDDSSPELLPDPLRIPIPYYALYLAYLSVKDSEAASGYWDQYTKFHDLAIRQMTGTRLPQNYPTFRQLAPPEERR